MKCTVNERRSTELAPSEWRKLERLARRLRLRNASGPRARKPSWRVLVRAIAQGLVQVSELDGNGNGSSNTNNSPPL